MTWRVCAADDASGHAVHQDPFGPRLGGHPRPARSPGADLTPPLPRADSVPGQQVNATERPAVDAGVTLYAHGGGFEQRNPGFEQVMAYRLSAATGRAAWALDYRLAPAHPFPAALDDVMTAYQSLLDRGCPIQLRVASAWCADLRLEE
jgi:acetyl esterase/lipase